MHDDEQQFIARVVGERHLQLQEVVDMQVRRVISTFSHAETLRRDASAPTS